MEEEEVKGIEEEILKVQEAREVESVENLENEEQTNTKQVIYLLIIFKESRFKRK